MPEKRKWRGEGGGKNKGGGGANFRKREVCE